MTSPPDLNLPPWLEYIHARTEGMAEDAACLSKGEVRYLLECYLGYEQHFAKGVQNLDIPYPERGTPAAIAAIANTLLKVEIASLREELATANEKADYLQKCGEQYPALSVQYEACQKQLAWTTKQVEDRDRALATQIEAYQKLEKKLVRLTGLAEDLVQEASEA